MTAGSEICKVRKFGSGPSAVRQAQLDKVSEPDSLMGTSHRKDGVKNLVKNIREGIARMYNLPEGYEVVLGNGGASAFWDIIPLNLVREQAAYSSFGEFGEKAFKSAELCPFVSATNSEFPLFEAGYPKECAGVDLYHYPHNETSTGAMIAPRRIGAGPSLSSPQPPVTLRQGEAARSTPDALTVVDGTSAAGGVKFDISQTDVYYFSPQKNFGSDGGLWLAILSPRAVKRAEEIAASGCYIPPFLNLHSAILNSRKNQSLNTPAIATLILLEEQVRYLNSDHSGVSGLDFASARTLENSNYLYTWAGSSEHFSPAVAPEFRSQTVVTLNLDDAINCVELSNELARRGFLDTAKYRSLDNNQIRIACFPNVELSDLKALTDEIEQILG